MPIKLTIMDLLSGISAGVGALSGIGGLIGGIFQNSAARREQQRILNERRDEYDRLMGTSYVDTPEASAVLNQASEDKDKSLRRAAATAVISGQTPEAQLASTNAINKNHSNLIRQIAAGATAYKERIRNKYDDWLKMAYGHQNYNAQSGNNLTTSGLNSLMSTASIFAGGLAKKEAKKQELIDDFEKNTAPKIQNSLRMPSNVYSTVPFVY